MNNLPLQGITIIDLSHRLPGPFCGKILNDLGATVIKIEDQKFKDPFISGLFAEFDPSFISWYENLNSKKTILRFDFNEEKEQEQIRSLVKTADAVIMGLPEKTRQKLGLTDADLEFNKAFVIIELLASRTQNRSMHDLNAMALEGLLSLYVANNQAKIIPPPFLPIAGISFGHKAATDLIASFILAIKTNKTVFAKTYLDEVTSELLGIFWPRSDREIKRTAFLHNGMYPCYSIYQTKDLKYVALAAVEEKFWVKFCEIFGIKHEKNRFHAEDNSVFNEVAFAINKYTQEEIDKICAEEDLCLSCIR